MVNLRQALQSQMRRPKPQGQKYLGLVLDVPRLSDEIIAPVGHLKQHDVLGATYPSGLLRRCVESDADDPLSRTKKSGTDFEKSTLHPRATSALLR